MFKLLPLAALLALAAARPALAQTPVVPTTPAVLPAGSPASASSPAATLPPASVPAYPKGYTDKHLGGSTGSTFPNGVPVRNLDNGTGHNDQPRPNQAQAGAQPTRSIFRSRKRRGQ